MVKLIAFCAVLCAGSSAMACGVLEKANPPVGSSTPTAALHNITLQLSERIKPGSPLIHITDADGKIVSTGKVVSSKDDTVISTSVPALAPGKYKVEWDVVWLDCDSEMQNHYSFKVIP